MHRYVDSEEPIPHIIKHRFSDVARLNFNGARQISRHLPHCCLGIKAIQGKTANSVPIGVIGLSRLASRIRIESPSSHRG